MNFDCILYSADNWESSPCQHCRLSLIFSPSHCSEPQFISIPVMASPTWYVFAPGSVIMQGMTDEGNFGCHFNPAVSLASTVCWTGAEHYLVAFPILCRQSRSLSQCMWVIPERCRHRQSYRSRLHLAAVCCLGWPHEDAGTGPAREAAPAACLGACELVGFSSCVCLRGSRSVLPGWCALVCRCLVLPLCCT